MGKRRARAAAGGEETRPGPFVPRAPGLAGFARAEPRRRPRAASAGSGCGAGAGVGHGAASQPAQEAAERAVRPFALRSAAVLGSS